MIYLFLTGLVLGISSVLAYSYVAQEVGFTPRDTAWHVENTKEALDDLYDLVRCNSDLVNTAWDYYYTGADSMFIPPCKGTYKIEVWGAQGGSYNSTYYGGYGGYAVSYLNVRIQTKIYVNVGAQGAGGVPNSAITAAYNGGGGAQSWSDGNEKRSGGGGATHIASEPGQIFELNDRRETIYIVAGGGGGAQVNSAIIGTDHSIGGHGGGVTGMAATLGNTPPGGGGTQIAGGTSDSWGSDGTFGKGGEGTNASGGGGGYYGGGSANRGAGGGSGFINSTHIAANTVGHIISKMYCYECTESDSLTEYTVSTHGTTTHASERNSECPNGFSSEPISACAKAGNGFARITLISV